MKITVCNVCRNPERPTEEYTIKRGTVTVAQGDLCAEHGGALESIITGDTAPPPPPTKRAGRRPKPPRADPPNGSAPKTAARRGARILTIEQIEEEKRQGKSHSKVG